MRFASPHYAALLAVIALAAWWHWRKVRRATGAIRYSSLVDISKMSPSVFALLHPYLSGLTITACVLFVLALSRPQKGQRTEELLTRGVDIMLCFDTSTSMRAEDFKPLNRLDAAKQAALEFVKGRHYDRIGIVVFSAMAFTQCPLTLDYGAVIDFMDSIQIGITQTDGTAIGTALMTCVNRLQNSVAKSKVVVLLTDGRNNTGDIDPVTAAKAAAALDIKIYTIGAGGIGDAPYPIDDPIFGRRYVLVKEDLDEDTLKTIAAVTDGLYFRATSSEMLKKIYQKIDQLEKTEIKVTEYKDYTELYMLFLIPGVLLLLMEIVLRLTYFKRLP
jgi:Ca-activated chloride channel family protein